LPGDFLPRGLDAPLRGRAADTERPFFDSVPMRRVLLISGPVLPYRISVYNYLWRRFRDSGWDFAVLTNRVNAPNRVSARYQLDEVPFSLPRYLDLIRTSRPDVVILFLHLKDTIFWPLIHWLKLRGIPVVFWTKGGNLDRSESRWRYFAFNYVFRLSQSLILYSANQSDLLEPRNRAKAFPANNTLNFEDIPAISEDVAAIKGEFGIPFKKFALFVGTMGIGGERKKVGDLVEAFRTVDRADVGAVIVGSGMPKELSDRVNARNTICLGPLRDAEDRQVNKLFKAADLFVIPGHVGLALNQAFYWGLPVVTEMGSHPPEIHCLKSGHNGFMVPENDIDALREKILLLLEDDRLRAEFSQRARQDVLRDASPEGMFQGFLRATEHAVGPGRERDARH
jgi:glycosyltransferase involved in cell wall biosynthesis